VHGQLLLVLKHFHQQPAQCVSDATTACAPQQTLQLLSLRSQLLAAPLHH
jgi:hypothetical protein